MRQPQPGGARERAKRPPMKECEEDKEEEQKQARVSDAARLLLKQPTSRRRRQVGCLIWASASGAHVAAWFESLVTRPSSPPVEGVGVGLGTPPWSAALQAAD